MGGCDLVEALRGLQRHVSPLRSQQGDKKVGSQNSAPLPLLPVWWAPNPRVAIRGFFTLMYPPEHKTNTCRKILRNNVCVNAFCGKYRDTPPVSIAILLQKYALLLAESSKYTAPSCITIRLPFVSRYLCRSIRVRGRWNTPNACLVCICTHANTGKHD